MKQKISIFFFIISVLNIYSQNSIKISGVILDAKAKKPIYGAHVYPPNYPTGTFSDENGSFSLQIPYTLKNDTLHISCLGYEPLKLKISEIESEKFFLKEKINELGIVNIIAQYSPRKILKKAFKQVKFNYPYKERFCAKAYFREYLKKDSATIHFFELVLSIADSGFAYDYWNNTQVDVDSVYSIINSNNTYYYWNNPMFGLWGCRNNFTYPRLNNKSYYIDSISYLNDDKIIHITYIPPKSKEITYKKSSINIYDDEADTIICYYDSTLQYTERNHFVVNLSNYAILEFSYFFIRLSKPNPKNILQAIEVITDSYLKITFNEYDNKYYPKNIIAKTKYDFYKNRKFNKISYKISIFNEICVKSIESNCENRENPTPSDLHKDIFLKLYKPMLVDSVRIKQFDDNIRKYYYSRIKD